MQVGHELGDGGGDDDDDDNNNNNNNLLSHITELHILPANSKF